MWRAVGTLDGGRSRLDLIISLVSHHPPLNHASAPLPLDPSGFKGLIDPEALGGDGGSAVAEEMEASPSFPDSTFSTVHGVLYGSGAMSWPDIERLQG